MKARSPFAAAPLLYLLLPRKTPALDDLPRRQLVLCGGLTVLRASRLVVPRAPSPGSSGNPSTRAAPTGRDLPGPRPQEVSSQGIRSRRSAAAGVAAVVSEVVAQEVSSQETRSGRYQAARYRGHPAPRRTGSSTAPPVIQRTTASSPSIRTFSSSTRRRCSGSSTAARPTTSGGLATPSGTIPSTAFTWIVSTTQRRSPT